MAETTPVAPSTIQDHRALVVESDAELNQLLVGMLQKEEWEVRFAANNAEALEQAKAQPYDLIITGVHSSGMEDVELLRRLRLVRPHTRLIIMTDEFTPGDVLAAIRELDAAG